MYTKFFPKAVIILRKGEGRTLKAGGSWIYDNEIAEINQADDFENGAIVEVHDFDGFFMGYGFINLNSKIRIRMLSRYRHEVLDTQFFRDRLKDSWEYRKAAGETEGCRLIFGESDFLPGLTVDKYGDILVVECLSLGMEKLKDMLLDLLKEVLLEDGIKIRGIYERSDSAVRLKEGLELKTGFIGDEFDTRIPYTENGIKYIVDVKDGQKTGFFLDQKYNRLAVQKLTERLKDLSGNIDGKGTLRALDCFTHIGTFALNMAKGGASYVLAYDISESAVREARENTERNGFSGRVFVEKRDVLEALPDLIKKNELFDLVVLDPPAFTKARDSVKQAVKGYREINMKGLKLVRNGGVFVTCSCSHFMTEELFRKTITEASKSVHKRLRQIEMRTQGPDHPILWDRDMNSYYLKFFIFQVFEEK